MDRKKLLGLDKKLRSDVLSENILIKKRGFYIYYNEPNKSKRTIKIHQHFCGQCSWGAGKMSKSESGKNGVWIGPFSKFNFVTDFIQSNFPSLFDQIQNCTCINMKYKI